MRNKLYKHKQESAQQNLSIDNHPPKIPESVITQLNIVKTGESCIKNSLDQIVRSTYNYYYKQNNQINLYKTIQDSTGFKISRHRSVD